MGRRGRKNFSDRKGTFDPDDAINVRHTKIGVWDLYEETHPNLASIPAPSLLERWMSAIGDLPFLWRMMKDIGSIRFCRFLLFSYTTVEVLSALVPAVELYFSGQLLSVVQTAVDTRSVDTKLLLQIALGRAMVGIFGTILSRISVMLSDLLNARVKQFYSVRTFCVLARMDLPTSEDAAISRQLESAVSYQGNSDSSAAWDILHKAFTAMSAIVQLTSQVSIIAAVMKKHTDGNLLAFLTLVNAVIQWRSFQARYGSKVVESVWAATTKNEDFIRMQGLKQAVSSSSHRQEIVAGSMWKYMLTEFENTINALGDNASDFHSAFRRFRHARFNIMSLFVSLSSELPQIVFTLRAVQYPATVPVSLASLNLITQTTHSFMMTLFTLFNHTGSIADVLRDVRKLYDIENIRNRVIDGTIPFPENSRSLETGVSIEFRSVSFKYPGSDQFALRGVSFKIEKGQLCVIVGSNGGGKSTVLKLIARLYDPTEGVILIDEIDIKTLKLEDLRRATSVLFQDYTHFPLSIKENIGLGDPAHAKDDDHVREAARLGGAEEFISSKLPEGFNTYLERPVRDYYGGLPEGTTTLFGRTVGYGRIRGAGGMSENTSTSLSGGQMQRIALSRTFMRSVVSNESIGLLLFDEPSASLDPTAEHDLFQRLRQLRGNKTMVFSSHRFGSLTKHADKILYMDDATIIEEGSHIELIKREGEYARIWNLQAQSFIS